MRIRVLLVTTAFAVAATAALAAPASAPTPTAAPMHSSGAKPAYPRLTRFPDAKIMAAVNALLAGKQKEARANYADCVKQVTDMKMTPDAQTWQEDVAVRYLSARYLSIEVVQSYYCAGAYPTNGAEAPITIDLKTGKEIDWSTMFKPGFLSGDKPGALAALYTVRYSNAKEDAECLDAVKQTDPANAGAAFWLDARKGLMFVPGYPHVIAACAVPMALSAKDLAPYAKDPTLVADLKAMGR
jgi:hypothetical protein